MLYNYKEKDWIIIGDEENVLDDNVKVHNHYNKNTNNQVSIHRHIMNEDVDFNDGENYNSKAMKNVKTKKDTSYQRYNDHNDVADEVNSKRFLKLNNDVGNVNAEHVSNNVLHFRLFCVWFHYSMGFRVTRSGLGVFVWNLRKKNPKN